MSAASLQPDNDTREMWAEADRVRLRALAQHRDPDHVVAVRRAVAAAAAHPALEDPSNDAEL